MSPASRVVVTAAALVSVLWLINGALGVSGQGAKYGPVTEAYDATPSLIAAAVLALLMISMVRRLLSRAFARLVRGTPAPGADPPSDTPG
jgi:hypothetical protein